MRERERMSKRKTQLKSDRERSKAIWGDNNE